MDYPVSDEFAKLQDGKFTDGDPINNIPPSKNSAAYQNMVFDELLNVLSVAGITPDENSVNQLATSINSIIATAVNNLIDSAPSDRDTLAKIAAALGSSSAVRQRTEQYTAQLVGVDHVEFTIPAWARRIYVDFGNVQINFSGGNVDLVLGTDSGLELTGYKNYRVETTAAAASEQDDTKPQITRGNLLGSERIDSGTATLSLVDPGTSTWVQNGAHGNYTEGWSTQTHYIKSLTDALSVIRFAVGDVGDAFTSGYVSLIVEGL
jgi:hypothetical protein